MNHRHCYQLAKKLAVCAIPKIAASSIRRVIGLGKSEYPDWYATAWEAQEQGYFVAGFVRHPLDRLVSAWANKTPEGQSTGRLRQLGFTEGMSFKDFVRHAHQGDLYHEDLHLQPQWAFVFYHRRFCWDFVGRFERIADDWARLSVMFGLPRLPHVNASERRPWPEYYDTETLAMACDMYDRDLRLFGYSPTASVPSLQPTIGGA